MRILIISAVSVLVTAGIVGGVAWKVRSSIAASDLATAVRIEPAAQGELIELITAPGEIQPRTKVSISARVSALITKLPFDEGMRVTKGEKPDGTNGSLLVQLDDKDLQSLLHSSEARRDGEKSQIKVAESRIDASAAQIRSQEIALVDAQRDLDRQIGLLKTKDISQSTVDTAQTKVDSTKAQLDAARHTLKSDQANIEVMTHSLEAADADVAKAKDELSYTTIHSPIDGIVTKRKAEVGEMAMIGTMNNAGTVILEVADLDQMMMFARVDETSIAAVQIGQHAKVRIQAFPDEVFDGTVETVALARNEDEARTSSIEGSTRYFEAKIKLDTKGRRIPSGLAADADIETKKHFGIKVPSQAVLGRAIDAIPAEIRSRPEVDANKSIVTVVYRVVDGKSAVTPVRVGPSDETHTLILAGLKPGDAVITGPFKVLEGLADATAVKADATPVAKPTTQPVTTPATQPAVK